MLSSPRNRPSQPGHRGAGGLHEPEPRQLLAWRASIDRDPSPFKRIIADRSFREYFGSVGGERLKSAPRGYPKDHAELDFLRLKCVTVSRSVTDTVVSSPLLLEETLTTFRVMKPFLRYLESLR